MNRKTIKIIVPLLIVIELSFIFLTFMSYSNKNIEEINKKNEFNKDIFAIYVERAVNSNDYIEYKYNSWPSNKTYVFSSYKCVDVNSEEVKNVLAFDYASNTAVVTSKETVFCYLYFDLDEGIPGNFNFNVIGEVDEYPRYTAGSPKVELSWTDTDIASYCIITTNNSDNCSDWTEAGGGQSASKIYSLTGNDGEKTLYAFIKDLAGNISVPQSTSITLDTTGPVIANNIIKEVDDSKIVVSKNNIATDSGSGVNNNSIEMEISGAATKTIKTEEVEFSNLFYLTNYQISVTVCDNLSNCSSINLNTKTAFCKPGTPLGECLYTHPTAGLTVTSLQGGLYRYQGVQGSVENYVCFGTTDKNTCVDNPNKHMYRIIGIDGNKKVKLIKDHGLYEYHHKDGGGISLVKGAFVWGEGYDGSASTNYWNDSTIQKKLNGTLFLEETVYNYVPDEWDQKIATVTWKYGENASVSMSANDLYLIESGFSKSVDKKIGLMYVHDYYYAYQKNGLNCYSTSNEDLCRNSWISLFNDVRENNVYYDDHTNLNSQIRKYDEWTMSIKNATHSSILGGYMTSPYLINFEYENYEGYKKGNVLSGDETSKYIVRPVFYLTDSVTYQSGVGTIDDPFIIN